MMLSLSFESETIWHCFLQCQNAWTWESSHEMGVDSVNFITSNSLTEYLFPISGTLSSASLEMLVSQQGVFPLMVKTVFPLNFKMRCHLEMSEYYMGYYN